VQTAARHDLSRELHDVERWKGENQKYGSEVETHHSRPSSGSPAVPIVGKKTRAAGVELQSISLQGKLAWDEVTMRARASES